MKKFDSQFALCLLRFTLFPLLVAFCFLSCRPDNSFLTDTTAKLKFSSDTLRFDTVFTQIGSATRFFKVVNTYNKPLRINKISLSAKTGLTVKLNVNGVSAKVFTNIDIPANDSIYVFAEVTVDPNAPLSESPFVINENIVFETLGGVQNVMLEAWGQNAIYLPNKNAKGGLALLSAGNSATVINFDDKKPYVIYGVLFVDSCILRIAAGAHIYVHGGLGGNNTNGLYRDGIIYILPNAHIEVNGTIDKPVVFEGDRKEAEFVDIPDQWAGVIVGNLSQNNFFNYTTIRNARFGLRVDSASSTALKNCRIYNTSASSIVATHATLTAENCLAYNTSDKNVLISYGGDYKFTYCTFSSYRSQSTALYADNFYCYERDANRNCINGKVFALNLNVTNSILYGSKQDEIVLYNADSSAKLVPFNYNFTNCVLRSANAGQVKSVPTDFLTKAPNSIVYASDSKLFKSLTNSDYNLDSLSIAQYKALPISTISKDILDKNRDAKTPDIGCFERFPR